MDNSIPICRSVFNHWIYDDAEFLKSWLTMLGRAQFTKEPKLKMHLGITYTLNYGEFIFGRKAWSEKVGISEERTRRLISLLVKDNMIKEVAFKGKFTIYKIVNYAKFNQQKSRKVKGVDEDQQPADTPTGTITANQQTPQQPTTNEEGIKKSKELKKNVYGICENVFLTQAEYDRLKDEFQELAETAIEFLSAYIAEKGYKSKSHNLAIRRWVIDAVSKKQPKQIDFGVFVGEE